MGFDNMDMVKYYEDMVKITSDQLKEEMEKEPVDNSKIKILIHRLRNEQAALNLNIGWREYNDKKKS